MNKFLLMLALTAALALENWGSVTAVECSDPETLANALKVVSEPNWQGFSRAMLRSLWPSEAGTLSCVDGSCQVLAHKGKVVADECECCEIFTFDLGSNERNGIEHLATIVIYHSASDKAKMIQITRTLAEAMGAPRSVVSTIDGKPLQDLYWNLDRGNVKEVALLGVRFAHHRRTWKLYIHFSRHAA